MWYRDTVTIFSESKIGTCDLTSASILLGKMGQNIWNWDCLGKLRTYGPRMYGASCYFKGTVPDPLFSAPVNSTQQRFLAWGSPHLNPEPRFTRADRILVVPLPSEGRIQNWLCCRSLLLAPPDPSFPTLSLPRNACISGHTCLLPSA